MTVTLTPSWAPYTIDLSGQSYSRCSAVSAGPWSDGRRRSGSFFVDDIQWQ